MARWSFTEHPASVGESYVGHLRSAFGFGVAMIGGGAACLVHGVLPFLHTTTGSSTVIRLHDRMVTHRRSVSVATAESYDSSIRKTQ
ncbi:hypothetical protein SAMN05444164_3253 [Bradyrhizobium erythrophlei]|uniref:Capsule biosynthesis protein n=2 Tax=Bradyrhizobium erythrophlei TaxID=1437360 RepID=A0A1H4WUE8_9BRAD|nr:DUF6356 family protein [Bradyrhizobium erythrophlei]SEC97022.1 hypothetical protein SAMN05444164_3253 [Bradyrhizobium erythrophlei]